MMGLQRLVAYERVSTARQRLSGLGLEAQRKTIEDFAASRGADVFARFTEIESGRKVDRPQLIKALHLAKVTGATLVIAKLDRLSRNAAFLPALRDSGVRFLAVDMPEANDLTVGIMALVAQQEREAISRRTKEALAVANARGVRLGNPNGAAALRRAGKGAVALRAAASEPTPIGSLRTSWRRLRVSGLRGTCPCGRLRPSSPHAESRRSGVGPGVSGT